VSALFFNTTGFSNTANGFQALSRNAIGFQNTATGVETLQSNTGSDNTAGGALALQSNTSGVNNTATGVQALGKNTTGIDNTADGENALFLNTTGGANTATGLNALVSNTSGSNNVALGLNAGHNQTTGSNNVYIGAGMQGVAGQSNGCYIASIFGQTSANGIPVLINSSNKLGTTTSSKRFKDHIKPMDKASESILVLKPVTFRYKKEIDAKRISQFGLLAEDVAKVNPDLVVNDRDGKPYTVRYEAVNAMLLNEFLKAHRKMELQDRKARKQQKEIDVLKAELKEQKTLIQKVTAQLEVRKPAPQTVLNNQ
jgi:hypothetical protein